MNGLATKFSNDLYTGDVRSILLIIVIDEGLKLN